ncbi:MAG TPA: acyl-CoA dehydrogenase family protein [Gordonia sp. (in: high G+C Gram-positive bacteria)]|uniref:acyl-CoA dehydrogenase family protein n=1 Tax=unclassified Gordonia (in: high G+C Gram-positive bacteria) TaxID=2657482 RepID=UPI000FBFB498|nr:MULTISPECIES: acyl-CoA dehydrogenase family protein [unclassified Gordonia (in: high G+C Gram-positive bacteria)]RUP37105.1 MAG: acyl-CoA dehydrogenase [Gordonia sp. (in: high G+C Gram-positive bacteria)]HNP55470.1 acyl-CoA dehydrogenase family protein [Gordonia sp. (in: high G+C Gram-positive bacteria)]HRC50113.1 acyl-CoA dehydrogenase family protein [Gordonia sp. (in: high G+C Gram-positive bacteria)]
MFEWSDEDLMVRDALRAFIDKEIRPHIDELETGQLPPYDITRKLLATFGVDAMNRDQLEKELAAQEAGEAKPKSGGGALSSSMALILNMELAGVCLGLVGSMGVSMGLTASTIRSRGTLAQKKRWLPGLVTMETVGAWAITEPDSGSDALGGMKTSVRRDGDGGYILKGQKTFITNGPYADTIVVFAKLDEGDGTPMRDRKVLTFVLDKGMEGLTQGKPFKKMGMMSSPTGELFFDDVRLSADRLLGETEDTGADKRGGSSAKDGFTAERIGIAALSLGIINECLRLSVDYAKNRKLWGQEIAQFQLIQLKLAEMEVARLNVQNMLFVAMEAMKAGRPPTLAQASAMKLYSSRAATDVAMEAVQLFGGNGYMAEYRVEQLARDAKSLMIYAGSNEIQVTHVAKGLLRD